MPGVSRKPSSTGYLVYVILLLCTFAGLLAFYPQFAHWSTLPLIVVGLVVGVDFVEWVSGRFSIFDPKGLLALAGVHLFLIAPVLLIATNYKLNPLAAPTDWRPWIGMLSCWNAVGLFIVQRLGNVRPKGLFTTKWDFSSRTTVPVLGVAFVVTGISQILVWKTTGGITTLGAEDGAQAVVGSYRYTVLGSAFPMVCLLILTYLRRKKQKSRREWASIAVMIVFAAMYFVFDGLRGSRSAFVWSLFGAVGIVHYFWRPISNKVFLLALVPGFLFLYLYGFYKSYGDEVLQEYSRAGSIEQLSKNTGRSGLYVLTLDMSRTDVQAILLWRWFSINYDERYGSTYWKSLLYTTIPKSLWAGRAWAPEKAIAGAEILYSRKNSRLLSSRVYGLLGESILNFGVFGILPLFLLYGLLMRYLRRRHLQIPPGDLRLALAPLWSNLMLAMMVGDSDNVCVF